MKKKVLFFLAVCLLLGMGSAAAQGNYSAWSGHLNITINTASLGLTNTVTNFPLLIRLNPSNFPYFSQTSTGGADIRFSKTNNTTALFYEIERWVDHSTNTSLDTAVLWIRVDTIFANNPTQAIVMHFGNSGAASESNGARVFDTANGFASVYHLKENGGNTADVTFDPREGQRIGSGSTQVAAVAGFGQSFSGGTGNYYKTAAAYNKVSFGTVFTTSAWVYLPSGVASPGALWSKANDNTTWDAQEVQFFLGDNTTNSDQQGRYPQMVGHSRGYLYTNVALGTDAWHFVSYVYRQSDSTRQMYINGQSVTQANPTPYIGGTDNAGDLLFIGRDLSVSIAGEARNDFNGRMDELQISDTVRSADWIKLSYESQKLDQSVLTFSLPDNDVYSTWLDSARIVINTTNSSGGANVTGTVWNFPLSIRLNPSNFGAFSQTLPSGADIRFAKSNGTHLPYEIERWVDHASNNSLDTAEIWVRMDTVIGDNATQYITMYWNKPGATSRSNPQAVFDVATGFAGAWHMNETPPGLIKDRTINAFDGMPTGTASMYGTVGKALDFNGTSDYITCPGFPNTNFAQLTLSTWVRLDNQADWKDILSKETADYTTAGFGLRRSSGDQFVFTFFNGSKQEIYNPSAFSDTNFTWYHVAGTYNGSEQHLYVNGVETATPRTGLSGAVVGSPNALNIGRRTSGSDRHIDGALDEMAISRIARTPFWIKLAYETQKPGGTAICYPATISTHPQNAQVNMGSAATFSVVAQGNNITYQWQRMPGGSSTWSNVTVGTGQTAATYTFTTAETDTNSSYRCVVSSCNSSQNSNAGVLTVCVPLVITTQPQPVTVNVGTSANFSVHAPGKNITYQWQRSTGGGAWSNITGATSASYGFVTDSSDTNRQFRCQLSGICNSRDSTSAAALTLCYQVIITTEPANRSVTAGQQASFTVAALGKELSYQWQRMDFGATSWVTVSGANAVTYAFTTLMPGTGISRAPDSGAQFRCVITSPCGSATSATAQLSVCTPPSITTNPQDVSAQVGEQATFLVAAAGTGLSYQWQRSDNGGAAWTALSGATATTYSFTTSAADTGSQVQFRCVVTGTCGTTNSSIARIGVCFPPQISDHPDTISVTSGQQAIFSVQATGSGLTYYWQRMNRGGATWDSIKAPAPAIAASYSFTATPSDSGAQFRCLIGGSCGSAISNPGLLRVCTPVVIDTSRGPRDTTVVGGDTARFSITVTGTTPTYQWQRSRDNGTSWLDIGGATSAALRFKTDTADTQTLYRCVVGGQCGNVTSRGALLTLCFSATITQHPVNALNIAPEGQVTFSVRASGIPLTYQWEKSIDGGSNWADIGGATGQDYTLIVSSTDNNARFRCRVSNGCSNIASTSALLTVCVQPSMVSQPVNRSVIEGQTAIFSISAAGTGPSYQWIKKAGGGAIWDTISGAIDTFYSLVTKTSDHGAEFRCVVSGTCGACTSSVATLTVYQRVHAWFRISDSLGPAPLEVRFTDSSVGTIAQWKWVYGDGRVDSSYTAANIVHVYDSAGSYTVKLVVSGPGGVDSLSRTVTVYSPQGNPVVMTGRYLTPTSVELELRNYGILRSEFPPPFVSGVRLWNRVNALPVDTVSARSLKTYGIVALKARGSEYKDTVTVPAVAPPDSMHGFMSQIVWNDDRVTPFAPQNGFLVLMRDTVKPANPVVLSGRYSPWDTVTFTLDSASKIDTIGADSVALWFGLGSDSVPDFSTKTKVTWWGAGEVVRGASGGAFSHVLKSEQFNTDRKTLYCAVVVKGKNGQRSAIRSAAFMIGRVRPSNPVVLRALAINANSISLSWNRLNPDSVEQVRIYFRTGGEFANDYDFSNVTPKDSVFPAPRVSDTADTVFRLSEKTRYHFAAQIFRDGLWSRVVNASKATDSTREADSSTIVNKVTVRGITFDTASNKITVRWDVDTMVGSNLQVGISWSLMRMVQQDSAIKKVADVKATSDSAEIDLGEGLRFDTTFIFYLWLKKAGEKWASPTVASTDTLRIPPFTWQSVRYSVRYLVDDTTRWVNDRIRFTTTKVFSPNDAQNYTGIIRRFEADGPSLDGFIMAGQSFRFTEKQSSMPLEVGLACRALPPPFTLKDVRMYRWNGSAWILNRSTAFDTAASMVYVRTSELDDPFAAMIDTLHPVVTFINRRKDTLERNQAASDTIEVSDNIGNLAWSFRCIEGDKSLAASDSSQRMVLSKKTDTARVAIAQTLVSEENGVRAAFIVNDGRFSDTIPMSRRVIRVESDATPIAREMSWIPLRVTAELDTPSVRRLWRMVDTTLADPKYDKRFIRLFRWYHHPANAGSDRRWLEYAPEHDTIFDFIPGRLFWVKLRSPATFSFGRALTMPLYDTISLPLNARGWTDFALPFRFGIRIGDIVDATRRASVNADSLQFYRWDTTGSTYTCTPFYLADLADEGLADSSRELSSRDLTGYSVYNPVSEAVVLRIPPTPLAMSSINALQKPASGSGWSVRVDSRTEDGCQLTPVYCGYRPDMAGTGRLFPLAPGFNDVSVAVYEEKTGTVHGHKLSYIQANGGCSWLLAFRNRGDKTQTIRFGTQRFGAFPSDFGTALYDPLTGTVTEIQDDEAAVTVGANSQEYRWLFVGNSGFISGASKILNPGVLSFLAPYPNPMRQFINLRYSLPFAAVSRVDFTVVDIRGRVVWQKTVREKSVVGGNRSCVWNGTTTTGRRLASGLYVVTMTAYDLKHKSIGSFDERVTLVR